MALQRLPAGAANGKDMPHRLRLRPDDREAHLRMADFPQIAIRGSTAVGADPGQKGQLRQEEGRLELIQAGIMPLI